MWQPCSLAQIEALLSPADVVGYGGAAGGGKTDLLLGTALTQHRRSIIFRRESTQLVGIEERSSEIIGGRGQWNGQKHIWRLPSQRVLRFGAVQKPGDWVKYQGQPNDFVGFDETPHFLENQVRTLMGWNRTTTAGQRCRVIMGFNPPTTAEGMWIIDYFGPWLDPHHPNPAKPGELRWFVNDRGKDIEVPGPEPVEVGGQLLEPTSRTFIPARVEDNPYYMNTGYTKALDALPEPLRSMMRRGDFAAGQEDDAWQVIPTAWVKAAQARWTPDGGRGKPMDALGVDVARGGKDKTVMTPRHDHWYGSQAVYPGTATPDGPMCAGLAIANAKDGAPIQVDVIGVGASVYDHLKGAKVQVVALNGSAKSFAHDRSGKLSFANKRAELWWLMREALDPVHGDDIALHPDRELLADLCAPRWKLSGGKVLVEPKDDIIKRIGRSPDRGESVVYARPETPKRQAKDSRPDTTDGDYDPSSW